MSLPLLKLKFRPWVCEWVGTHHPGYPWLWDVWSNTTKCKHTFYDTGSVWAFREDSLSFNSLSFAGVPYLVCWPFQGPGRAESRASVSVALRFQVWKNPCQRLSPNNTWHVSSAEGEQSRKWHSKENRRRDQTQGPLSSHLNFIPPSLLV
jgi:hypothetical protein